MDYLADTNVILRFLLQNEPEYKTVRQAIGVLKARRERVFTTSQNIAEFWNVCTRPATVRGGLGLSVEATERRLRLIERHFIVLSDSHLVYAEWKRLIFVYKVSGVNVYDARIIAAMTVQGIQNLITFNAKDFKRYSGINILEPHLIK